MRDRVSPKREGGGKPGVGGENAKRTSLNYSSL